MKAVGKGVLGALCLLLATQTIAQSVNPGLLGSWKYLRNFTYVSVDAQDRIFQCRILPDLNVYFAGGKIDDLGVVTWGPVRFFSLYGAEVAPSGQEWSEGAIELRTQVMFLTGPGPNSLSNARREFDRVPSLPTICGHYLSIALD